MRVAIVGGPGVGKSTLVRQLADLYHNGSYGEGEKGVWPDEPQASAPAGLSPTPATLPGGVTVPITGRLPLCHQTTSALAM